MLKEIGPPPSDVKEVLQGALQEAESFDAVIVLALRKGGGTQYLRTSTMNHLERCFLSKFLDAKISTWFSFEEE